MVPQARATSELSTSTSLDTSDLNVIRAKMAPPRLTLPRLLFLSFVLRIAFLLYGLYQDAHSALPYTDIDYLVFTDASRALSQGLSPYTRATYRYTPLLAYLLYPTTIPGFFTFGKVIFALSDLLAGYGIYRILLLRGTPAASALRYTAYTWLLNPMVATISTRGSSEALIGVLVILLLWTTLRQQPLLAGTLLGLATHLKIYPVIYAPSILWALETDNFTSIPAFLAGVITRKRILFTVSALTSFCALNAAFYALYGDEFLLHTFTHHFHRLDHRHNFSPYHTLLYLVSSPSGSSAIPFAKLAFIPQMLLSAVLIPLATAKVDLPGTMFAQTFAFVAFNKVCTSQYFMWYLVLLAFVVDSSRFFRTVGGGVGVLVLWVGGQAAWLYQAWRLEFLGVSTFWPALGVAGLGFFAVNAWMCGAFVEDLVVGRRKEEVVEVAVEEKR